MLISLSITDENIVHESPTRDNYISTAHTLLLTIWKIYTTCKYNCNLKVTVQIYDYCVYKQKINCLRWKSKDYARPLVSKLSPLTSGAWELVFNETHLSLKVSLTFRGFGKYMTVYFVFSTNACFKWKWCDEIFHNC